MVDPSGTTTYTYTVDDLTSSITKGSTVTSYTYNGLGSRVSRNGQTLYRMGVAPGAPVLKDSTTTYTPGISERQGTHSYFYLLDGFGNVGRIHDSAGAHLRSAGFDAFGIQVWHTGTVLGTPMGFGGGAGSYTDPTTGGIGNGGEWTGTNDVVDHNSFAYNAGVATGTVHGIAMDVATGGTRTIASQGIKQAPQIVRIADDIRPPVKVDPPINSVDEILGTAGVYVL
jgi:YD repeat-containing protein